MDVNLLTLTVVKTATAALGSALVYYAWRAYLATRSRPLLLLATGMAVLTLGIVLEGAVFQIAGWSLPNAHVAEAIVSLTGYIVLVASLRTKQTTPAPQLDF